MTLKDPDIRAMLRAEAIEKCPPEKGKVRHVEEFDFRVGAIADYAVITEEYIGGIEIKSDGDNLGTLQRQVEIYDRMCNLLTIVVTEKHLKAVSERLPLHWGITLAQADGLKALRESQPNPKVSSFIMASLLLKRELAELVSRHSSRKALEIERGVTAGELRSVVQNYTIFELGHEEVKAFIRRALLDRPGQSMRFNPATRQATKGIKDSG